MKKKNILIIGGTYFIGKHFLNRISAIDGFEVHVFNRGSREVVGNHNCLKGDRDNLEDLEKVFQNRFYDCVIDFCGYRAEQVEKIFIFKESFDQYVFVSSSVVYGEGDYAADESTKCRDVKSFAEYARGKMGIDKYLVENCSNYIIVRPSFVYGPGEYHSYCSNFMKLIHNNLPIIVPEGENIEKEIQPLFVGDLVNALIDLIKSDFSNRVFNISGPSIKISDYFRLIHKIAGNGGTLNIRPLELTNPLNQILLRQYYTDTFKYNITIDSRQLSNVIASKFNDLNALEKGIRVSFEEFRNDLEIDKKIIKYLRG